MEGSQVTVHTYAHTGPIRTWRPLFLYQKVVDCFQIWDLQDMGKSAIEISKMLDLPNTIVSRSIRERPKEIK